MAEIVNLRTARKHRDKVKKRSEGTENSVRFGRTKVEKSLEQARAEKARTDHAAHQREEPEP
ncbi:MAG: DUF4169 family protein [Albidovulum sp.]